MTETDNPPEGIIPFLLGEGTLDGQWWGQGPPMGRGAFWWRSALRSYVESDRPERGLVEDWSRLYRLRELMDRHQKEGEPMPIAEPYIGIITAALRHLRDDGTGSGDA